MVCQPLNRLGSPLPANERLISDTYLVPDTRMDHTSYTGNIAKQTSLQSMELILMDHHSTQGLVYRNPIIDAGPSQCIPKHRTSKAGKPTIDFVQRSPPPGISHLLANVPLLGDDHPLTLLRAYPRTPAQKIRPFASGEYRHWLRNHCGQGFDRRTSRC